MFSPCPEELSKRSIGAMMMRWNVLREELLFHIARTHREGKIELPWEWLEEKHQHMSSKDYFTYEQDLSICQLVIERGCVGQPLNQQWFREHAVGRLPLLHG